MKRLILASIRFYRNVVSPLLPPTCRFTPSCSRYTLEAVEEYGVVRGLCKGVWRVSRCHPFARGGYDPVK